MLTPTPTGPNVMELLCAPSAVVCGIVNVTPDSFSDGGQWCNAESALVHARSLVDEGAVMLDVGGESTRPGARRPALAEELRRVLPAIEAIVGELRVPVSVDTSRPEVMRAAVAAGASMVNDVRGLRSPHAREVIAELGVPVCLMHMAGEPGTMQVAPHYDDPVREVCEWLAGARSACVSAGIHPSRILLDPGFGFGKNLNHNMDLLANLSDVVALGSPVMVGMSRKSMIGEVTGQPVGGRVSGSVAAALIAVQAGARVVRVHDVRQTVDALGVHGIAETYRRGHRTSPAFPRTS